MNVTVPFIDIQPRPLAFSQWRVWAVLLLAGCSAYLSLALHYQHKDQAALDGVIESMARLHLDSREIPANPQRWLVDANRLMPQAARFARASVRDVSKPLAEMTRRLGAGEAARVAEQIQIRQQLAWMLAELRASADALAARTARTLHTYYLSVFCFVLALGALLYWRLNLRTHSPLKQLLADDLLFANVPVALSLSDADDKLLRANEAFERITGIDSDEMRGQQAHCEESEEEIAAIRRMRKDLDAKGRWVGEYRMRCQDGSVQAEKMVRIALGENLAAPEGFLTMSMEAVHSDAQQRFMLWQAHHDNLTKLPNANLLNERLARAQQEGKHGAVISIDLDNFKNINDSLGHAGADRILIEAAHRIALTARESDTVARTGGDVFVMAIAEFEDIAEVERIARAAVESIGVPFRLDDDELFISASAGVTIYPDDGTSPGELLQKSDAARLDAKSKGGGQVQFFEDQMNTVAARRFELETNLRKAIAGQEFELHFQPIIDISRNTVYGAEALLRWHNPSLGMVSPAEFIPVAEDTGLIVDIGRWVVAEVQRHLRMWQTSLPGIRVSLNVSARQLVDEEQARDLLAALGREFSEQITVELTESALVDEEPGAATFLQGLRDLDLHVALDDFGTGFSSVGYLRDYEFDVLKVDKSFIDGIGGVRDLGLVASIVAMGRILGMRVVAEGVEEEEQVQRLKRIGCDFVQGYFYSKPLPATEFVAFVNGYGTAGEVAEDVRSAG